MITETYTILITYRKPTNNHERSAPMSRRTSRGGTTAATDQNSSGRGDEEEEQHDDVAFVHQHADVTSKELKISVVKLCRDGAIEEMDMISSCNVTSEIL